MCSSLTTLVTVLCDLKQLPHKTKAFSVELRHNHSISKSTLLSPGGSHWSESTRNTHTHTLADVINPPRCDWPVWGLTLTCAEFDSGSDRCGLREDKGHPGTRNRYPLAAGASVLLCSALYQLTLHNWALTSTKWRWLWRPNSQAERSLPEGETEDVTCHLYCPPSLCFFFLFYPHCLCGEKRTN